MDGQIQLEKQLIEFIKNKVRTDENSGWFREPLVGFSSAADPRYDKLKEIVGAHHLHPTEILSSAGSVISFFIPFEEFVVVRNRRGKQVAEEWARAYLFCNDLIGRISEELAVFLRAGGWEAGVIQATHTYDPRDLQSFWSHRSAAFIAGMGSFGLHRLLITPKGCAGRFGTVITSAPLTPGRPYEEENCYYYREGTCRYCTSMCPTGALGEDGSLDKHLCHDHLLEVDRLFPELDMTDVCGKCVVGPCAILEK